MSLAGNGFYGGGFSMIDVLRRLKISYFLLEHISYMYIYSYIGVSMIYIYTYENRVLTKYDSSKTKCIWKNYLSNI